MGNDISTSKKNLAKEAVYKTLSFAIHFHRIQISLLSYVLISPKLYQILIYVNFISKDDIFVYDGPDHTSDMLLPRRHNNSTLVYKCSAFYCVADIFTVSGSSIKYIFVLQDIKQDTVLVAAKQKRVLYLNLLCKDAIICFFPVRSNNNSYVNISFQKLNINGRQSSSCSFAGVSVYETKNGTDAEISTTCTSHKGVFKNRDILSSQNRAILVFFNYFFRTKYAEIEVLISSTTCKPVQLNMHKFNVLCANPDTSTCKQHLSDLSTNSSVKFSSRESIIVSKGKCGVLQLQYNIEKEYLANFSNVVKSQTIRLYPKQGTDNSEIHFKISGFFKGGN